MKLTKEQELLRENIREFVKNEMAEYPDHVDETNCIPQDIIENINLLVLLFLENMVELVLIMFLMQLSWKKFQEDVLQQGLS